MISSIMISRIADHLWQSTAFAGVVWVMTLALRNNRARVRHGLWIAASCKFLIPLSLLIALGGRIEWRKAPVITQSNVFVISEVSEPFTAEVSPPFLATVAPAPSSLPAILFGIWACGFLALAWKWGREWTRMYFNVRSASPLDLGLSVPVRSSAARFEPGVFGVFRPVLLLPDGIFDRLTPAQLKTVIAHELCHVRHRDNLIAAMHMFVETVFWFHPLVWWIGTRMVEEREQACDEEVLSTTNEPKAYAEGILSVCKLYVESPLTCVSGVTGGSNLKHRIEAIMSNRLALKLTFGRKLFLAAAAVSAASVTLFIGFAKAQSQAPQKFEVASIRPCQPGQGPVGFRTAPGRFRVVCFPAEGLVGTAYIAYGDAGGGTIYAREGISGGPAWFKSDQYDVEAKAEGNPAGSIMAGPMLRALLEDRFKLKLHRETKEIPVYELTVAKNGFKLKPLPAGSCTQVDPFAPTPEGSQRCNWAGYQPNGMELRAATLDQLADHLTHLIALDRPVINRTGIAGIFDFRLSFTRDETMPRPAVFAGDSPAEPAPQNPAGPSIFTAMQEQFGLKLNPAKGPGTYLVIDSVERPTEN
jgi:bla regulator protein blaR1